MFNGLLKCSLKEKVIKVEFFPGTVETRTLSSYNMIDLYSEARSTETFWNKLRTHHP